MSSTTQVPADVASALAILMRENAIDAGEAAEVIQAHATANGMDFTELASEIVRVDRAKNSSD
jgi:hypothetical protein